MNFLKKHFKVLTLSVGAALAFSSIGLEAWYRERPYGYRRGCGCGRVVRPKRYYVRPVVSVDVPYDTTPSYDTTPCCDYLE